MQAASLEKIDLLCQKLDLQPEDHLVEIGCGWGGLAIHAASRYGCRVTGVTLSPAQLEIAQQRVAAAGLQDRVTLQLMDYRDLTGQYDKLVSVEMIEAVGFEFHDEYFRTCCRLLKPEGRMAFQGITILTSDHALSEPNRFYSRIHFSGRVFDQQRGSAAFGDAGLGFPFGRYSRNWFALRRDLAALADRVPSSLGCDQGFGI